MRLLRWIYLIYFCGVFLAIMILFYPLFKWSVANPKKHHFSFRISKLVCRLVLIFSGLRLKSLGKEPYPPEPCIVCPNHTSYIDILTMYCISYRPVIFMGKKELEKWPFIKLFFKGKHILVDRKNPVAARKSLEMVEEKLMMGYDVVIFPEGGIGKNLPALNPLKMGAFKVAQRGKYPIVPVIFFSNWKRLGIMKGRWKVGPGWARYAVFKEERIVGDEPQDLLNLRDRVQLVMKEALKQVE